MISGDGKALTLTSGSGRYGSGFFDSTGSDVRSAGFVETEGNPKVGTGYSGYFDGRDKFYGIATYDDLVKLRAEYPGITSGLTLSTTVNDLRQAFAVQRLLEMTLAVVPATRKFFALILA